jgi:hypothetical protein
MTMNELSGDEYYEDLYKGEVDSRGIIGDV